MTPQEQLAERFPELQPDQCRLLAAYAESLWTHNRRLNLTRHTDLTSFMERDLVDTLPLVEVLRGDSTVMDLGSGGGVPGIPLSILLPQVRVLLCESVGKKAAALREMTEELGVNCDVIADRAESFLKKHSVDSVVVRAVAALPKLLRMLSPVTSSFRRLLLIKGPRWSEEAAAAVEEGLVKQSGIRELARWTTAGRDSECVLAEVRPGA